MASKKDTAQEEKKPKAGAWTDEKRIQLLFSCLKVHMGPELPVPNWTNVLPHMTARGYPSGVDGIRKEYTKLRNEYNAQVPSSGNAASSAGNAAATAGKRKKAPAESRGRASKKLKKEEEEKEEEE